MNDTRHTGDDFAQIKGIGAARARWLRDTFGVQTFGELAALSPGAIEAALKAQHKIIAPREIELWLAQAHGMASRQQAAPAGTVSIENGWQQMANFVVVYEQRTADNGTRETRTSVYHMEADVSHQWPGIEREGVGAWMAAQIGVTDTAPPPAAAPVEVPLFDERLQRYIAKADTLTNQHTELPTPPPRITEPEPPPLLTTNQRLLEVIAKADALTKNWR